MGQRTPFTLSSPRAAPPNRLLFGSTDEVHGEANAQGSKYTTLWWCEDALFLTLSRRGKQAIRSSAAECQVSHRAQQVLRHSSAALPSSPGPRLATCPRGVTSALGEGCTASPATALEAAGPACGESPAPGSFHPAGTAPAPCALKQPQQGTGIWVY